MVQNRLPTSGDHVNANSIDVGSLDIDCSGRFGAALTSWLQVSGSIPAAYAFALVSIRDLAEWVLRYAGVLARGSAGFQQRA